MPRHVDWLRLALLVLSSLCSACGDDGDDDVIPIEQIPPDKPIVALTPAEERGLCAWGQTVAQRELPPAGTTFNCGGVVIALQAQCVSTTPDPARCSATVMEWQSCVPPLFSRLADDPCSILELQTPGQVERFVNETPGCENLGGCATTMR